MSRIYDALARAFCVVQTMLYIRSEPPVQKLNMRYMSPFIGQQDDDNVATRTRVKPKVEKPKLYKVLLLNDDYTPRDFVVQILKAEFRVTDDEAYNIMITAHQKGLCVVAVYTKDVAETKAARATDMAKEFGFPLMFETEPEE